MADRHVILPLFLAEAVDQYVESELRDAAKYDNRQPLDESGVWSLHRLAAEIYATGWSDGEAVATARGRAARQRGRQA